MAVRAASRERVISREQLEEFLKRKGFTVDSANDNLWTREERRASRQKGLIGARYLLTYDIAILLADKRALQRFLARYETQPDVTNP